MGPGYTCVTYPSDHVGLVLGQRSRRLIGGVPRKRDILANLDPQPKDDDMESPSHDDSVSPREARPPLPKRVSSSGGTSQPDEYVQGNNELDDALAELDARADEWIGSNWQRLVWYESMKAKRLKLQKVAKDQEALLEEEMNDLRAVLVDLDTLVNVGFIDDATGEISPAGWTVLCISLLINCAIIFALFRFFSGALSSGLSSLPF